MKTANRDLRLPTVVLVVLACLGVMTALAWRGGGRPTMPLLVTADWLAGQVDDPDLVLLHVGDKDAYPGKHIAGARLVTLGDLSASHEGDKSLMLEMPAADDLRARLEALGISDASRVVVYSGEDGVASATRVIFTLDYAGLGGQASLLDGGLGAWTRAGRPTTDRVPPPPKRGTLAPLAVRPIVVDAEAVRASVGKRGVAVVDARSREFYEGTKLGGMPERKHPAGHIAGALSVPFDSLTEEGWRSPEQLRAIFEKAGVKPGDTVIGYCHVGQQATAMLFAARSLGHPVRLYDGSFEDWSLLHPDYPIEASRGRL
jgi:thiosulfate/3-mercaptopyruvate sulfurtransferase